MCFQKKAPKSVRSAGASAHGRFVRPTPTAFGPEVRKRCRILHPHLVWDLLSEPEDVLVVLPSGKLT